MDRNTTLKDRFPANSQETPANKNVEAPLFATPAKDPLARTAIYFSAALLILLVAILVIMHAQYKNNISLIASIKNEVDAIISARDFAASFADSSAEYRAYLITGDQEHLTRSQAESEEFMLLLRKFELSIADERTREIIDGIQSGFASIAKARSDDAAKIQARHPLAEIADSHAKNAFATSQQLNLLFNELRARSQALMDEKLTRGRRESRTTLLLMIAFSVLCLSFAFFLSWWFTRRLSASYWQMKAAMDKFRMTVKISDDVIWEWDLRSQKVQLFEGVFSRFGYGTVSDASILNSRIHPDDRERVTESLRNAIDNEDTEVWSDSYRLQRTDGSFADVVGRALIARDEYHRPLLVLGALIDTSELSQAIRARDEMSGVISHELKNPVASIEMAADLLERELADAPVSDAARSALARMKPISHRMSRLLRDLLDITRIESRTMAVEIGTCDAGKIIDEVMFEFQAQAQEKKIALSSVVPENLPFLNCDRDRTLQIVSNLVGNAVKFTPAFGRISVKATAKNGNVEFEVSDSGPGIEEEHLERVFDRFWRASRARKDSSGLGLAIAKGLVHAQGGRIWVESEVGRGASFHFTVPCTPQTELTRPVSSRFEQTASERSPALPVKLQQSAARSTTPPPRSLAGVRILLVDDSQDALFLTKTLLELAGAEVIEAESAQAALFVMKTFTPHILLTDIEMPGKTGIDLLNEVRNSEEFRLPIFRNLVAVALTAHEAHAELQKVMAAGFDSVMLKPISYDQIVNTLAPLLQKSASADSSPVSSEPQPPPPSAS